MTFLFQRYRIFMLVLALILAILGGIYLFFYLKDTKNVPKEGIFVEEKIELCIKGDAV